MAYRKRPYLVYLSITQASMMAPREKRMEMGTMPRIFPLPRSSNLPKSMYEAPPVTSRATPAVDRGEAQRDDEGGRAGLDDGEAVDGPHDEAAGEGGQDCNGDGQRHEPRLRMARARPPTFWMMSARMAPMSEIWFPAEMSISPEMRSIPMPLATMPRTAIWEKMLMMLLGLRKRGLTMVATTHRAMISPMSTSDCVTRTGFFPACAAAAAFMSLPFPRPRPARSAGRSPP